jgi:hypothetical protein
MLYIRILCQFFFIFPYRQVYTTVDDAKGYISVNVIAKRSSNAVISLNIKGWRTHLHNPITPLTRKKSQSMSGFIDKIKDKMTQKEKEQEMNIQPHPAVCFQVDHDKITSTNDADYRKPITLLIFSQVLVG